MPIVSSLIGKPYNEDNFERIADALMNVNNVENVKNVLKCENNLWNALKIDWIMIFFFAFSLLILSLERKILVPQKKNIQT